MLKCIYAELAIRAKILGTELGDGKTIGRE